MASASCSRRVRVPAWSTIARTTSQGRPVAPACPSCRAALHACRQCAHFDPGQRFECTESVPARIADKQQPNDCGAFALRVTVERDTSSGAVRPDDARRGFNNLFKK